MQQVLGADNMTLAAEARDRLKKLKEQIEQLRVCCVCWVEQPTLAAQEELGVDTW